MAKKKSSSKAWLAEHHSDIYVQQAQREGYRSRACYKLLELQQRDKLRQLLAAKGADQQLIEFAVGQLTNTYTELSETEQYSFKVELPEGLTPDEGAALAQQINEGLAGLRAENHALMLKLAAQLVLAEVRLFQHERAD